MATRSYYSTPKITSMQYINVPLALMQEVKSDSLQWSLLAMSVALKCYSPSSTYIVVSEKKMRHDLHIGLRKLRKLLDAIRAGHPLFSISYDRKGRELITARCLRRDYAGILRMRDGRLSLHMSVAKVTLAKKEDICIANIEKEMRQLLLLAIINNKTRADELRSKGRPLSGTSSHAAETTLSVPYLAKATSRSSRTVIRMTQKAHTQGHIAIKQYPLLRCCDDMTRSRDFLAMGVCSPMLTPTLYDPKLQNVEELIRVGNLGFKRQCNDYQLLTHQLRHRFQHIIYAHRRRLTHNISISASKPMSQTDLHALFD